MPRTPSGFTVEAQVPVDVRFVKDSKSHAISTIPRSHRYIGLTIYIVNSQEFFGFYEGVTDEDFRPLTNFQTAIITTPGTITFNRPTRGKLLHITLCGGGGGGGSGAVSAAGVVANGGGSGGRGINGSIAAGGGIDVGLGLYNCPGGASSSAGTGMGTQNLVNGGSAGGGITTANVPGPGAAINSPFHPNLAGGFIPSAPSLVGRNGNPGATTAPSYRGPGQGGTGGGACIDAGYHGGNGGAGGFPGGGGGGGGAKRVDNSPSVRSGAGGNGAAGFVRIIVL